MRVRSGCLEDDIDLLNANMGANETGRTSSNKKQTKQSLAKPRVKTESDQINSKQGEAEEQSNIRQSFNKLDNKTVELSESII